MEKRPHFHLAGIPIRVEPFFFFALLMLGYLSFPEPVLIATWVAIGSVSILLHEMGHAVAFRLYGIHPRVVLHGFGGLTSGQGSLTPARSIVVSLAGPLSALILLGLPSLYLEATNAFPNGYGPAILTQLVFINVGWSLLNLVPILPLDGGNVMASVIDLAAPGKGMRAAQIASVVVAGGGALLAFSAGPQWFFIAIFLAMFAAMNVAGLRRVPDDAVTDGLTEAHRALVAGQPQRAAQLARGVLQQRPAAAVAQWATELLAWASLLSGDVRGAQQVAGTLPGSHPPSRALQGSLALAAGHRDEGLTVLAWVFVNEPAGPGQLLAAMVAARYRVVPELTQELLLLGPPGGAAADLLAQLLQYAGFTAEAGSVVQATGRPAPGPVAPPAPPSAPAASPAAVTPPAPVRPSPPSAAPQAWDRPERTSSWPSQPPSAPPQREPAPWPLRPPAGG